jgi:hypothetical protein
MKRRFDGIRSGTDGRFAIGHIEFASNMAQRSTNVPNQALERQF